METESVVMTGKSDVCLHREGLDVLQAGANACEACAFAVFSDKALAMEALERCWSTGEDIAGTYCPPEVEACGRLGLWFIAMSQEFIKATRNIDRKIQGKILEAINSLCEDPLTQRGDTVKPLSNGLKGLWRYRIGDFRLVYKPDLSSHSVLLHAFAARGQVYE